MHALPFLLWIAIAAPAVDGPTAFKNGTAAYHAGKMKDAVASWEQAFHAGFQPAVTSYQLACGYARLGDKDAAFRWLDKVAELGGPFAGQMKTDDDLASLRADPRWQKAFGTIEAAQYPCKHDPKAREFDFWLGEWNVVDAKGNPQGKSHVDLMIGDCVLLENWTGGLGTEGKSFNLWDAGRKKWKQTWVDETGEMHVYTGELVNGAMKFEGERVDRQGVTHKLRLTFTPLPEGKVRQFMEDSADGGKTYTVAFDGIYVKRKP